MSARDREAGDHVVAIGQQLLDRGLRVGKGTARRLAELSQAPGTDWQARRQIMSDEVRCDDLVQLIVGLPGVNVDEPTPGGFVLLLC